MKGFLGCVYKDCCLFLSAAGIITLLLPMLLALAFSAGFSDSANADNSIRSFPIAVLDEDATIMSRALVGQLRRVELFSKIKSLPAIEFEFASEAERESCFSTMLNGKMYDHAAIIVIPKDYFYSLYRMDGTPIEVYLNGKMELESKLTEAMIGSVSEIILSERNSQHAAYSLYSGGKMDDSEYNDFCTSASMSIIDSALGRRDIFKTMDTLTDGLNDITNSFLACSVCMLMLFCCICVLKTMPEELGMGVFDRFIVSGGEPAAMLLSKLISAFLFTVIGCIPVFIILDESIDVHVLLVLTGSFFACFVLIAALSIAIKNRERFMLTGAVITACEMLFGGVIYPIELFPDFARLIGKICIPFYTLKGLNSARYMDLIPFGVFILITGVICILVGVLRYGRGEKHGI